MMKGMDDFCESGRIPLAMKASRILQIHRNGNHVERWGLLRELIRYLAMSHIFDLL